MGFLSAEILKKCGFEPDTHVLLAFSGGSDSTALLLVLKECLDEGKIGKLSAAHYNHMLRGSDADADAVFCEKLCRKLEVPFYTEKFHVAGWAAEKKVGIEQAARILRYGFLTGVKEKIDADCIAVAHHADDQAETVLMHLMRGSGLKGLGGMRIRTGDIVRPLLQTSHQELLAFLSAQKQAYCMDMSNEDCTYDRNRVRMELLPLMEQIRPDIVSRLGRMAESLQKDEDYLAEVSSTVRKEAERGGGWNCRELLQAAEPVRDRVLLDILREALEYDITGAELDRTREILNATSGKWVPVKGDIRAWRDGDVLRIGKMEMENTEEVPLIPGETVRFGAWEVIAEFVSCREPAASLMEAYMNADMLPENAHLRLRTRKEADRFSPLGMRGSKLLSDAYTDRKMPDELRRAPLVVSEEDILFVPGYTIAEKVRVTEKTGKILHIKYKKGEMNV